MKEVESPKSIDAYILGFPKHIQDILKKIRLTIRQVAPQAEELISYQIPAFKLQGSYLIYFAGFKSHVGLYPLPPGDESFEKQILPYRSGKASIRFPLDKPIPYPLVKKMVRFAIKRNEARALAKKTKAAK